MEEQIQNQPQQRESDWVDAQEILQLLHISAATLKSWRRRNIIVHSKIGGKIFYDKNDVLDKLDFNKTGAGGHS